EFSHIEFEPSVQEIIGRDFLQEAWHAVKREDAELMLLNTAPGTYLFRKDRFAGVMEEIISAAKKSSVQCITLSYLDPKGQVRDRTIVTWKDHWLFYDDDPTLSGRYFESLEHLLSSMETVLKRPLPALRSRRSA
ncbi:MAG TPA: SH2 domain-containing protein, partial [Rhabdochlamydiaceae bacterium]